ncbi:Hypothetical predicted protein [Marmota monax]|uniref:Uncharacterized protein n=1 Tax=Marmota monax TaxID=9995 RepID=A0A5E4B072_MARMO|nr:hypothetical protein GHT09_013293 [Marmota monax]VTJ63064.1 Hypothetical predicted protein [Marmota monax]
MGPVVATSCNGREFETMRKVPRTVLVALVRSRVLERRTFPGLLRLSYETLGEERIRNRTRRLAGCGVPCPATSLARRRLAPPLQSRAASSGQRRPRASLPPCLCASSCASCARVQTVGSARTGVSGPVALQILHASDSSPSYHPHLEQVLLSTDEK